MAFLVSHVTISSSLAALPENQDIQGNFNSMFYVSMYVYPVNGLICQ